MKAIGFNQGQYGDLVINLIACRALKQKYPDCSLTFGINQKYAAIKDIFLHNQLIDDIHIWDAYNYWPSNADMEYLDVEKFNIVFHPMPQHSRPDWYLYYHQTQEVCLMHGLIPPDDLQIELTKYFPTDKYEKTVAVNLFAETLSYAPKVPSIDRSKEYCQILKDAGYNPVQVGLSSDPQVCEQRFIGSFFDTIKFALGCDFVLTVDSALCWIMSGYKHPVLGLYNYKYYAGASTSQTWQPINTNAIYIESDDINIDPSIIKKVIKYYDC